jgi:ATP-dependent Clp protease protease subunit
MPFAPANTPTGQSAQQPAQPQAPALSKPVVIYFCAPVTHPATTKLRTALCNAVNLRVPSITVFMSSSGGMVEEGMSLYGCIRSLPVPVTIHNIGSIDSIALAVYLAGSRRLSNPDATFLMHDFYFPQPVAVTNRHQASDISVGLIGARKRFMEVLRVSTNMTNEQFESLKFLGEASIKTATTAKEVGITHEIQQAVVPAGAELYNVDY